MSAKPTIPDTDTEGADRTEATGVHTRAPGDTPMYEAGKVRVWVDIIGPGKRR